MHPENAGQPLPMIMTGPASAEPYFRKIDDFVGATLGAAAQDRYKIIIDDPQEVARQTTAALDDVLTFRNNTVMPIISTGA